MLVNRKQDWDIYEEQSTLPKVEHLPQTSRLNIALRVKCLVTVVIAAIIAMVVTVQSESIVRNGYDLVKMKAQVAKIEKENEILRLDIAKLKSPQRIQQIATSELGMVVPQNVYCAATTSNNVVNQGNQTNVNANNKIPTDQVANFLKAGKAEASKGQP